MTPPYVPGAGDLVWITFNPQAGREQRGRRPGLILSPRSYNERAGLALACPVTSHVKGYPFEVRLPEDGVITGAILTDHVRSLDWRQRDAEFVAVAGEATLNEVREKLRPLLGL